MSRFYRAGLILLGVMSVADLSGPLLTDGEHPPMSIALVGAAVGLASLALIISAWRGATRAVVPLVILRVLSALAATPGLWVSDVPGPIVVAAGATVVLNLAGCVLLFAGARRPVRVS